MLCVKCKSYPVYVKKYLLCGKCYGQKVATKRKSQKISNIPYKSEIEFVKRYFTHNKWIYQPATFRINKLTTYRPDFYDGERNVFIEVSSCINSYDKSLEKVALVRILFPAINFEFRTVLGELINETEPKKYLNQMVAGSL